MVLNELWNPACLSAIILEQILPGNLSLPGEFIMNEADYTDNASSG